jgi:hypothetical protein
MEYIILAEQQNTYPTTSNYKKTAVDVVTLTGNFDTNKLNFKLPNLDSLITVPDTSFRFLLSIDDKIYTSPLYYTELITSYNEANPYFIQSTFQNDFLIKYSPADIDSIIKNLRVIESNKKINVTKNVFILEDGSYDNVELVKYIDWLVSPIGLDDIETNGVLSTKQISSYVLPEIPKPESLVVNVGIAEVTEENIQAYEWEYIRKRNLDKEPLGVRETQNTTSREIYRINEGNKFIGNLLGNGLFEVFDDAKTARVGYIKVSSDFATRRFKRLSGPFNIKILTIKQPSNTLDSPSTPTPPSTPTRPTGGATGGGSTYGGGYSNGDANQNNIRYNQR